MSTRAQTDAEIAGRTSITPFRGRFDPQAISLAADSATPLLGRERELQTASDLIRDETVRLLTITGPGGIGKTRLAIRLVHDLEAEFADGAAFVPLATTTDPALVTVAIAQALKLREAANLGSLERIRLALENRQFLLVLDNFEHVRTAASDISALLATCPRVKVLATSRVPLYVTGEQELAVPPLGLPGADIAAPVDLMRYPSVALFAQRARAVKVDFALTETNAGAVATICRRLDGLPLAIELAAARAKVLSPPALLARLSHGLDVLTGGPRDQPDRLQTLRAAVSWSYYLLSEADRLVFSRLSVFHGGFDLEAAEAVAGDGVDTLSIFEAVASLVDCSLLQPRNNAGGEIRFTMMTTVREFALEQLQAENDMYTEVQLRHAKFFLELVERAYPQLFGGPLQQYWLDRCQEEHDNLRAALRWAEESGDAETALRLAAGLYWYWYVRGHLTEGRAWLQIALSMSTPAPSSVRARALLAYAATVHWQGDPDAATEILNQGLSLARECSQRENIRLALGMLGGSAEDCGDYARAARLFQESLALFSEADTEAPAPILRALLIAHLGVAFWGLGDLDRAATQWNEALARHREIDDSWGVANTLGYIALGACEQGDVQRAARAQHESLTHFSAAGSVEDIAAGVTTTAAIAGLRGEYRLSARLFGAAQSMREAIGMPLSLPERALFERVQAQVKQALPAKAFDAAYSSGKSLTATQAVDEALSALTTVISEIGAPESALGIDLTPRENDVLQLLVQGQTDRQIADALFISPRTAQGHVARLFDKLGVSTRTAAVAAALQADMVQDHSALQ